MFLRVNNHAPIENPTMRSVVSREHSSSIPSLISVIIANNFEKKDDFIYFKIEEYSAFVFTIILLRSLQNGQSGQVGKDGQGVQGGHV